MFWAEKTMHEKDAQEQYDPTSLKEFEKAKFWKQIAEILLKVALNTINPNLSCRITV